jgi:putative oxidoreductase
MTKFQAPAALSARLMLALLFCVEGWGKLTHYAASARYMDAYGVPHILLPLVIATELGGGLLVACGLLSRAAAFALAGFCLLTALLFHGNFASADQTIHFYKDIAIAGGFLGIVAFGPGEWSVDAWLARPAASRRPQGHAAGQPQ